MRIDFEPPNHLRTYLFQPDSGPPIMAEWGSLSVPENRQRDNPHSINLPFVRFPCISDNPGIPLVFLQGGPGTSVISHLSWLWGRPVIKPDPKLADFIFIEQRGFGQARPCLDCPGTYDVALNQTGSSEIYRDAHRMYLSESVSLWRENAVDLDGYNVREMAADIDDLRQVLGYERISLLGGSFGSHHGLAMLRYYGKFIERAMLWSIEGPNHTLKLPSNIQLHLVKLNHLLQSDAAFKEVIPNLIELMATVLDRLEREPVTIETTHPKTNEQVFITLGKYDLQLVTSDGLGKTPFLRALPVRYLEMDKGDYTWLAEQTIRKRVDQKSNLMYELTDFASGATQERKQQITMETPMTLLGNAIIEPFHELGDILGNPDMGDEFRGTLVSDVPTLLVAGSLDVRTPISNAEELLPDLSNGELLTVDGVSHDLSVRGDHIDELAECRNRFFRGESLPSRQLKSKFKFFSYEVKAL